eukprot:scaffold126694_cov34-Attheya_sp.AAC.1
MIGSEVLVRLNRRDRGLLDAYRRVLGWWVSRGGHMCHGTWLLLIVTCWACCSNPGNTRSGGVQWILNVGVHWARTGSDRVVRVREGSFPPWAAAAAARRLVLGLCSFVH